MNDGLVSLGWIMFHECTTCSGHVKHYNHPDKPGYQLKVKVKNNTFTIFKDNNLIAGPYWLFEVDKKLKQNDL